jgi:hypothetical protein
LTAEGLQDDYYVLYNYGFILSTLLGLDLAPSKILGLPRFLRAYPFTFLDKYLKKEQYYYEFTKFFIPALILPLNPKITRAIKMR